MTPDYSHLTNAVLDPDRLRLEQALDRIAALVRAHQEALDTSSLATWRVLRQIEQTALDARRGGRA